MSTSMEVENPLPPQADEDLPAVEDDNDEAMPTTRAELRPLIDRGMQEALDRPAVQSKVEVVAKAVYGKLTEAAPNWCV